MNEDLEKKLAECEEKKEEYFKGWQREKADFINYKNKEDERLNELVDFTKEQLFDEIIPVLDNFILAEKSIQDKENENIKGLLLIKKQLENALENLGFEEIESLNQEFDPSLHEALEEVDGEEKGLIIEEIEKGYKLNGKIIRPAKVKIIKFNN